MDNYTLVTGASSGFGAAIARRFGKEGRPLILAARREEKLEALKEELKDSAQEIITISLDVRDEKAVSEALSPYAEKVSILINNAGLALGLEPAQQAKISDWDTMVDTNIKGLLYVTNAILPSMVKRDHGLIINMGSVAGKYPYPGGNAYGATKAFVRQFTRNLKADLLGTKVRVTNIEPAAAETEFSLVRHKGNDERAGELYKGWEPFTADDIAETCYWISSLPERMNVNCIEIMGTGQSFGPFRFAK